MNEKIAAVIVTFNRIEFLKQVVNAVKNQSRKPDEIIIVNNSSTDGTLDWLKNQNGLNVIIQENVGSSGGQYTGIREAYLNGNDWIWVMDDDIVPDEHCLQNLLKNIDKNTIHAPLRFSPDGKPYLNDTISFNLSNPFKSIWIRILNENDLKEEYIEANGLTFEGPLFHRDVVKNIGLPEKAFFIYGDDTEYFIRAKKSGAVLKIVKSANATRLMPGYEDWKIWSWKHYYILRNLIAIDVLHGTLMVRLLRPFGYFIKWITRCKSLSDFKAAIEAFFKGYFYKSIN